MDCLLKGEGRQEEWDSPPDKRNQGVNVEAADSGWLSSCFVRLPFQSSDQRVFTLCGFAAQAASEGSRPGHLGCLTGRMSKHTRENLPHSDSPGGCWREGFRHLELFFFFALHFQHLPAQRGQLHVFWFFFSLRKLVQLSNLCFQPLCTLRSLCENEKKKKNCWETIPNDCSSFLAPNTSSRLLNQPLVSVPLLDFYLLLQI